MVINDATTTDEVDESRTILFPETEQKNTLESKKLQSD
jgi:hypothetical protein